MYSPPGLHRPGHSLHLPTNVWGVQRSRKSRLVARCLSAGLFFFLVPGGHDFSAPCNTPLCHGAPSSIFAPRAHTALSTPNVSRLSIVEPSVAPNAWKSSLRQFIQFCSGRPLPGSSPRLVFFRPSSAEFVTRCLSWFTGRFNHPTPSDFTPSSRLWCIPTQCTALPLIFGLSPLRSPLLHNLGVHAGALGLNAVLLPKLDQREIPRSRDRGNSYLSNSGSLSIRGSGSCLRLCRVVFARYTPTGGSRPTPAGEGQRGCFVFCFAFISCSRCSFVDAPRILSSCLVDDVRTHTYWIGNHLLCILLDIRRRWMKNPV